MLCGPLPVRLSATRAPASATPQGFRAAAAMVPPPPVHLPRGLRESNQMGQVHTLPAGLRGRIHGVSDSESLRPNPVGSREQREEQRAARQ
eukprot:641950-Pyramimonas_sp.AAC.1